jgi:hypothetical protein
MKKSNLPLPSQGSSMAMAVLLLEQISQAIQASMQREAKRSAADAYDHFREKAYKLLSHYVDHDLHEAFGWLAQIRGAAPKRLRGSVRDNNFHLGLLAMTGAAGVFMSPNKLRDLAKLMQQAHEDDVPPAEFNEFVSDTRKYARVSGRP